MRPTKAPFVTTTKLSSLKLGKLFLTLGLSLMIGTTAMAQTDFDTDPDNGVPIDGGVSLLVAAGVSYGAKQWHNARKGKKTDSEPAA